MANLDISKSIFTKKTQDFTFIILFLFIFSVFIFFAINPSLKTAFSLKKEEKDLTNVDNLYEQKIINISAIQSQIENYREELPMINQAISDYPQVNKMVNDIKSIADKNFITIKKANISEVNLSQSKKSLERIQMIIEGKSNFENLYSFIQDLFKQRRLKSINNLSVKQEKESSDSGQLTVILTIEGFYL